MKRNRWCSLAVAALTGMAVLVFAADEPKKADVTGNDAAEKAWAALKEALIPQQPPAEWRTNPPTKEQIANLDLTNGILAGVAADMARDFHTKYPSHTNAADARMFEWRLLQVAVDMGATNRQKDLLALRERRLTDPEMFRVLCNGNRRYERSAFHGGVMHARYRKTHHKPSEQPLHSTSVAEGERQRHDGGADRDHN